MTATYAHSLPGKALEEWQPLEEHLRNVAELAMQFAEPFDLVKIELNFRAPAEDGYAVWQWDRQEAVRRVAKEWSLPLGKQVRLSRWGIDGEFVGNLQLVTLPARMDKRLPLELKIDKMHFPSTEIEACTVIG